MLWLAVHLPLLPIDALGPWPEPHLPGILPVVVTEQHRVLACNDRARALGVRPGLRAATASAFAPQAVVLPRALPREAVFVEQLALALACLTPQVSLAAPMVLLEVHASLRLFGGIRRVLRRARGIARDCGVSSPGFGCAPTPLAAALLAAAPPPQAGPRQRGEPHRPRYALTPRSLRRALDAVPLARLAELAALPESGLDMLSSLGARSVGDLRRLPRAGLARRLGSGWLAALDRADGALPDLRRWIEPPPHYDAALELPHRADHVEPLLIAAQRLLQGLAGWLALHWRAAQAFELVLRHERLRRDEPDAVLTIELAEPSRDAAHLMTVLRERLQRHALAAPVYALRLHLLRSVSFAGRGLALLADAREASQDFAGLIDRLRARLGAAPVQRLALREDPRPERACAEVRPEDVVVPRTRSSATTTVAAPVAPPLPRPAWLLRTPLPLAEEDGRPVHGRALTLLTRAERIEHGWFDGAVVRRDYHVALGDDGLLRWVCLERGQGAPRWFLHGLFA